MKIVYGSQEEVNYLPDLVAEVLAAIAEAVDNPGIKNAFVTDGTRIGHFMFDENDEELNKANELLGIKLEYDMYLTDAAILLKKSRE